jgi:hypothetical protein
VKVEKISEMSKHVSFVQNPVHPTALDLQIHKTDAEGKRQSFVIPTVADFTHGGKLRVTMGLANQKEFSEFIGHPDSATKDPSRSSLIMHYVGEDPVTKEELHCIDFPTGGISLTMSPSEFRVYSMTKGKETDILRSFTGGKKNSLPQNRIKADDIRIKVFQDLHAEKLSPNVYDPETIKQRTNYYHEASMLKAWLEQALQKQKEDMIPTPTDKKVSQLSPNDLRDLLRADTMHVMAGLGEHDQVAAGDPFMQYVGVGNGGHSVVLPPKYVGHGRKTGKNRA